MGAAGDPWMSLRGAHAGGGGDVVPIGDPADDEGYGEDEDDEDEDDDDDYDED